MASELGGKEVRMKPDEIIVSKTDTAGRILYVNQTFCTISGFTEPELLGQPHSLIRHEFMPRCVFKLLWDTVSTGQEIFAYVVNKTKFGDYYWVLAHVTPSYGADGKINGYHSMRRMPDFSVVENAIMPLYRQLLTIENSVPNRKDGMQKSFDTVLQLLNSKGVGYDEFVLGLEHA